MIVTLSIPDELYAKYAERDKKSPQAALVRQLERFQDFAPTDRALIFPSANRKELEKLHGMPIESASRFVDWVRRLASVKIEETDVTLSAGQRARLLTESKFYHKAPEEYIKQQVSRAIVSFLGA